MTQIHYGHLLDFSGGGDNDNDELFTTSDISSCDAFMLMSSAGAVDVLVSLDGVNFSTAPLSLQDFGAVDTTPVLVTAAGRVYGFAGKFRKIRALQNGATAAQATLIAWKL
ncbi:MAG TPA: hypothetical protein VGA18_08195 [Rhodothermales bacterium]